MTEPRHNVGQISMPHDVRILRLPRCGRCEKVAPECRCGRNAAQTGRA